MFGSLIVNREIYRILSTNAAITAVVGDRIFSGRRIPQGKLLPALLYYPESSVFDSGGTTTRAEHITGETLRYVVRIQDRGTSTTSISAGAKAERAALAGLIMTAQSGESLTFTANGGFPLTDSYDGDQMYLDLGTIYNVTVDSGG